MRQVSSLYATDAASNGGLGLVPVVLGVHGGRDGARVVACLLRLCRDHLAQLSAAADLQRTGQGRTAGTPCLGEAFQKLIEVSGQTADTLTGQLYAANNVGVAWYIMGSVGLVAAAGLIAYGRWTYQLKE